MVTSRLRGRAARSAAAWPPPPGISTRAGSPTSLGSTRPKMINAPNPTNTRLAKNRGPAPRRRQAKKSGKKNPPPKKNNGPPPGGAERELYELDLYAEHGQH